VGRSRTTYWWSEALRCWISDCFVCKNKQCADTEEEVATHYELHAHCFEHAAI